MVTIGVGDRLPALTLCDEENRPWRTENQAGRPMVLILHRHLA